MSLYVYNAGSKQNAAAHEGYSTSTNPMIIEDSNTTALSVVCYEIRNDNSNPPSAATETHGGETCYGVSYSSSFDILNREYPDNTTNGSSLGVTTATEYLENLGTTQGYLIKNAMYDSDGTTLLEGQSLSGMDIETNDYFVILFADDHLKHHVAKITSLNTDDVAGDSFEFEPKYSEEIPINTKYAIYKGPLVTDTSVHAVGYGLEGNIGDINDSDSSLGENDGTGPVIDVRHGGLTYASRPLFYFYNDRLKKNNELDHDTKYMVHYSKSSAAGSEMHEQKCFMTQPDYSFKIIDYSPYSINAKLVDNLRTQDEANIFRYSSTVYGSYTPDFRDWNYCLVNANRNSLDLRFGNNQGDFTGPKRYAHYDSSDESLNVIPDVLDLNIYESINKSGTYSEINLLDSRRIYSKKINLNDKLKINKAIGTGSFGKEMFSELFGKVSGTAGSSTLTFKELEKGQDLRLLLKSDSNFEMIRIGDYYYSISAIAAPAIGSGVDYEQVVTINKHRNHLTENTFSGTSTLPVTITDGTAYRKSWSDITDTLMVSWNIDTTVDVASPGIAGSSESIKLNGRVISSYESRIHNYELYLTSSKLEGYTFIVDYGDSINGYVKLKEPRKQMYQKETLNQPNLLDYYQGSYILEKNVFTGSVENFEDYTENGIFKYRLAGRGNISKLLGPIINKDYTHSKDLIYSDNGPIFDIAVVPNAQSGGNVTVQHNAGIGDSTIYYSGTGGTGTILVGDKLFKSDGTFIGEVESLTSGTSSTTIIVGGLRCSVKAGDIIYRQLKNDNVDSPSILSFSKALSTNTATTNKTTSLYGTANKGIYFTSGPLVGTSSHTDSKANGYDITAPLGIRTSSIFYPTDSSSNGKVDRVDYPFYCNISNELYNSEVEYKLKSISTQNNLTEYNILDINTADGKSIITLAPNLPLVLGRIDRNAADVTGEHIKSLSEITFSSAYSEGTKGKLQVASTSASYLFKLKGLAIYNSNNDYLGNVTGVSSPYGITGTNYIILDRPLQNSVSSGSAIGISTGTFDKIYHRYNNGLYLLNTHGLKNGGILQLANPCLNSKTKPIAFDSPREDNDTINHNVSGSTSPDIKATLSGQYGSFNWRYFNLQKGSPGSIYYRKYKLKDQTKSLLYAGNTGKFNAYANAIRFNPGKLTNPIHIPFGEDYYMSPSATTTYDWLNQGSPETRGIFPATGSAYADWSITGADSTGASLSEQFNDYYSLPQSLSSSWASGSNYRIDGFNDNPVKNARDSFEIIDPKVTRTFLFGNADIDIDSMRRSNHIGNSANLFTDFDIMIRGEPSVTPSNILHENYEGSLSYVEEGDNSYEILPIESASINTNEMKRFGLMRLIDVTYDWHFNEVDAENPPDKTKLVDCFDYKVYQKIQKLDVGSSTYPTITAYGTNQITVSNSCQNFLRDGESIYSSDGTEIGVLNGDAGAGTTISLTANPAYVEGAQYTGGTAFIYQVGKNVIEDEDNLPAYAYRVSGFGGIDEFLPFDDSGDELGLHMLQSYIFNNQGSGLVGFGGYAAGSNGSFLYNYGGLNFHSPSISADGSANDIFHILWPPIFAGQELKSDGSTALHAATNKGVAVIRVNNSTTELAAKGFTVGCKLYSTINGYYLGRVTSIAANSANAAHSDLGLTGSGNALRFSLGAGELITVGHHTNADSDRIGRTNRPSSGGGGYHVGAKASEIALQETSPAQEYTQPSNVVREITRSVGIDQRNSGAGAGSDWLKEFSGDKAGGTETGTSGAKNISYYGLKQVILDRFTIEDSTENIQSEKGMVMGIGLDGGGGSDCQVDMYNINYQGITNIAATFYGLRTSRLFAEFQGNYDKDNSMSVNVKDTNKSLSDGIYSVFKAFLNTTSESYDSITYYKGNNGASDIALMQISTDLSASPKSYNNFLNNCPNLTGCYLVSSAAKSFYKDSNTLDYVTQSSHENIYSNNNYCPKQISYIISHTIDETSSGFTHHIIFDNCPSGSLDSEGYRIMRPAQVAFHENSPSEIDLYKLDNKYTKMAFSDEMYNNPPDSMVVPPRNQESGIRLTGLYADEGVQSMYVLINNDHCYNSGDTLPNGNTAGGDPKYLIPRGTNYLHGTSMMGDTDSFIFNSNSSYDMLLNDGTTQLRKGLTINVDNLNPQLKFSGLWQEMVGVVSLGEIFTVTSSISSNIKNPKTCGIGTSVTIASEVEKIVNDLLEENNIVYTQDPNNLGNKVQYPYYLGSKILGADLYSSIDYLLKFKNKKLIFDGDNIKTSHIKNYNRHSNINLNYDNTDLKVIELTRTDSAFDFYNEVIVYGKNYKAIKRDSSSIKKIGRKTLEEFNEILASQTDVDKRAQELLNQHTIQDKRITVKIQEKGLEHLKVGDVIRMSFPDDHIETDDYIVLMIKQDTTAVMELEVGKYRKGLEYRLAELLVEGKQVKSILRGDKFKDTPIDEFYSDSIKIKPIQITGYKITSTGYGSQLGFNTTTGFGTLLGFGGGTTSTTEILREDLT